MEQTGIFKGRVEVRYPYARWGYTRGNGKTWHGGIDLVGLDDSTVYMPSFKGQPIQGKVRTARIVTAKSNKTWEWGWYVCVALDSNQTPDTVSYLYFCHCKELLVKVGDVVKTGDKLAIMGNSGNAALADPPYEHVHFEVRRSTYTPGLDPTAYAGVSNEVGIYGTKEEANMATGIETLIDVSKYQGDIAWVKVPYRAIIRVGYRGYGSSGTLVIDPKFKSNMAGAITCKKLFGYYFFSQAVTEEEARAEVDFAHSKIGANGKGLPLFIDCEWSGDANRKGRADGISKAQRTKCARAFCERAEDLGYVAGVYTFTSFAGTYLDYEGLCKDYVGWLADTRTNYNTTLPRHIHQYGQGSVNGISGNVDLNHLVKEITVKEETNSVSTVRQKITIGPVSNGDAYKIYQLCKELKLTDSGLYKSEYV